MAVIRGLRRVGPGVLSAVSCHLLVENGEAVLIDSGFIHHHRRLRRVLAEEGLEPAAVRAVLQTHGHLDHAGRLREVQAWCGAPAYIHPDDRPILTGALPYRGWARVCGVMEATGRVLIRYRAGDASEDLVPGAVLPFGGGLEVVHLPGHTPGHCGFWRARDRLLFAGDLIAAFGLRPHLSPRIFNACPARYPEAFRRVLELDPALVVLNHYWRLDPPKQAGQLKRFAEQYLKQHGG